jgi:hypothetical protein
MTQRFFPPLLRMLYHAWKWREPYDPDDTTSLSPPTRDATTHDDLEDAAGPAAPASSVTRDPNQPLTMEQQPSYFVMHHPCFAYWESGVLATILDVLYMHDSRQAEAEEEEEDEKKEGTKATIAQDANVISVFCAAYDTHASWLWALRLRQPRAVVCVYGNATVPNTAPWYSSDPVDSSELVLRPQRDNRHAHATWSIAMDARRLDHVAQSLRRCAPQTGNMAVHFGSNDTDILLLLFALGNCFRSVSIHTSKWIVPSIDRGTAAVWVGVGKRHHSPFTQVVHDWLEASPDASTTPANAIEASVQQKRSFQHWKTYATSQLRAPVQASWFAMDECETLSNFSAEHHHHIAISNRYWTEHTVPLHGQRFVYLQDDDAEDDWNASLGLCAQHMYATWFPPVCLPLGGTTEAAMGDDRLETVGDAFLMDTDNVFAAEQYTPSSIWRQWKEVAGACLVRSDGSCAGSEPALECLPACRGPIFVGVRRDAIVWIVDLFRLSRSHRVLPAYDKRFACVRALVAVCGTGHACVRVGQPWASIR